MIPGIYCNTVPGTCTGTRTYRTRTGTVLVELYWYDSSIPYRDQVSFLYHRARYNFVDEGT